MTMINDGNRAGFQRFVDFVRKELAKGFGGNFMLEHPKCPSPVVVRITPDGVSWLVTVQCGDRFIFTNGEPQAVKPDEFVSGLYVFFVACLKAAAKPPARSVAS